MKKSIEIIKRGKLENIILKLIIIVFCIFTIILNSNAYNSIFKGGTIINTYKDLETAIMKNNKFITLDLTNAKLMKYSIISDDKSENINIYSLYLDDRQLLISLKDNTALTNKVTGELLKYNIDMSDVKKQLEESSDDKFIEDRYFSNINYTSNEKVIKIEFYSIAVLLFIIIVTLTFDVILYFNPKKTYKYRKNIDKSR